MAGWLPEEIMISIGITGGIGSGKTTVCRLFETLGAPVYYADDRAKAIMVEDAELVAALKRAFGNAIYDEEGNLQRQLLADRVFRDPDSLNILNGLVHPAVFRDAARWAEEHRSAPYIIREAALLFESGSYRMMDEIVMVWAPEALRIERAMARDGLREEAVRDRMKRQWPDEKKRENSNHLIINDGQHLLIPQVIALHRGWLSRDAGRLQSPDSRTTLH